MHTYGDSECFEVWCMYVARECGYIYMCVGLPRSLESRFKEGWFFVSFCFSRHPVVCLSSLVGFLLGFFFACLVFGRTDRKSLIGTYSCPHLVRRVGRRGIPLPAPTRVTSGTKMASDTNTASCTTSGQEGTEAAAAKRSKIDPVDQLHFANIEKMDEALRRRSISSFFPDDFSCRNFQAIGSTSLEMNCIFLAIQMSFSKVSHQRTEFR